MDDEQQRQALLDKYVRKGHTVEIQRVRYGQKDEEEAAFETPEEARDWARVMALQYGYRVWINGTEYTRKEIGSWAR